MRIEETIIQYEQAEHASTCYSISRADGDTVCQHYRYKHLYQPHITCIIIHETYVLLCEKMLEFFEEEIEKSIFRSR